MRAYDAMRDALNELMGKYADHEPLTVDELASLQNDVLRVVRFAYVVREFDSEGLEKNAQDFASFAVGFALALYENHRERRGNE